MKWLGVKSVRLSSLVLPGDFKQRLKAPHVAARAKSIAELGVIALPVVEWPAKRLIAGNDRVAALTLNGADVIEVRAVEGTEAELRRLMLAENIERRPKERDELIAEYVGSIEEELAAEAKDKGQPVPKPSSPAGGRPQTLHGAARERAAQALGVSVQAVRKAEERAAAPEKKDEPPAKRLYEDWGVDVPKALHEAITAIIEPLDSADQLMRGVQSSLTRAIEAGDERPEVADLRSTAKKLAQDIRARRPRALCPYCKGVPALRRKCAGCIGAGFILGSAVESIPAELKMRGADAMVAVDGKPARLALQRR